MKVWILTRDGDTSGPVYAEDYDIASIPWIAEELDWLADYEEERERFWMDYAKAKARGYGEATVEERFSVCLADVVES